MHLPENESKGRTMNTLDRFRPLTPDEKDNIYRAVIDNCELMTDGGCWVYRGTLNNSGYPMRYIQGKMRPVGRFMLCYHTRESFNIKADACHIRRLIPCDNPDADDSYGPDCPRACVNPSHLEWGTHGDNCKEKEAISFRFGWNARKPKTRSLATTKAPPRVDLHVGTDANSLVSLAT
jgi:hypothetical protein